ncbi:Putative_S-adenosylmethionine-dependent methyltransferase [Hexamita inflata]|uniref:Trimethylguanosine synthase n=1 Tax=Hexamita inflata TaxID=28002 RepID=A0AA86QAR6_9EUKA|nr:Putative S-adenosylmethionine-dependent methyltransferase [Hexamita inflata]
MSLQYFLQQSNKLKNIQVIPYKHTSEKNIIRKRQNNDLLRYFEKRYQLFEKYDQNIQMDDEMLFSVCPEQLAREEVNKIYEIVSNNEDQEPLTCIDLFGGAGGLAIQLSALFNVFTVELSPQRCSDIRHNASIYNKDLTVINGDCFTQERLFKTLKPKVITISPPWGGSDYQRKDFDLLNFNIGPYSFKQLLLQLRQVDSTQVFYFVLPKRFTNNEFVNDIFETELFDVQRQGVQDCGRVVYEALWIVRK